jgi:hypothetical protein
MNKAQTEMNEGVAEWLDSYRAHRRYMDSTERLLSAFAQSWGGSRRYVAEAFADFREALLKEHGLKHIDAVKVLPTQKSGSE